MGISTNLYETSLYITQEVVGRISDCAFCFHLSREALVLLICAFVCQVNKHSSLIIITQKYFLQLHVAIFHFHKRIKLDAFILFKEIAHHYMKLQDCIDCYSVMLTPAVLIVLMKT
jgi:hypothetical protein